MEHVSPGSGASSREEAILKWLDFYEEGGFVEDTKTKWPLKRVAWRAGELRLDAAAEKLERLLRLSDPDSQYALLWSLGRCASSAQADALQLYAMDPGYTGRIAREGLRRLLQGEELERFLDMQRTRVSWSLREKLGNPENVEELTEMFCSGVHDREIARVYLEFDGRVHSALLAYVKKVELTERSVEPLNELFQAAVFRGDGEMFGAVAHRLDTCRAIAGRVRKYWQRRTRRTLRRWAESDQTAYRKIAVGVLMHASAEDDVEKKTGLLAWTLDHARAQEEAWRSAPRELLEHLNTAAHVNVRGFASSKL